MFLRATFTLACVVASTAAGAWEGDKSPAKCPAQYETDGPDKVAVIPCGASACDLPTYLPLNETLQMCDRCVGMLPIDVDVQEAAGDDGNYTLTFGAPPNDNVTIDVVCGTCTLVGTISLEIPCHQTPAPSLVPVTQSPSTPAPLPPGHLCPKPYETDGPDKVAVIPCGASACDLPTYLPLNETLQMCDRCVGMLPIDVDVQEAAGDDGNYTLTFGAPPNDNVTIDVVCGTCTLVGTISLEIPCHQTPAPSLVPVTQSPSTPAPLPPGHLCPKPYETDGPDKVAVIPCGATACDLPTYLPLNETLQMCDRCVGMLPIDVDVQEVAGDDGNYTLTFGAPPDDNVTIDVVCGTCTLVGTISLEIPCHQTPAPSLVPVTQSPSTPAPLPPGHLCPKPYETDGLDKVACIPCGASACAMPTYLPLNETLQMCDRCVGMLPIDVDVQEVAGDEYALTFGVPHGDKLTLNVSCGTCTLVGTISLEVPCHQAKKKKHKSALFVLPIVAAGLVALVGGAWLLRRWWKRSPTGGADEKLPLVGGSEAAVPQPAGVPLQEGNATTLNLQDP